MRAIGEPNQLKKDQEQSFFDQIVTNLFPIIRPGIRGTQEDISSYYKL